MTRKDYNEIARVMHIEYAAAQLNGDTATMTALENIARSFADYFKRDNSRFDADRFMSAVEMGR